MLQYHCANLPNLICPGFGTIPLQINQFRHARLFEYMMASARSYLESQIIQQATQIIKLDIIIRQSSQNLK